MLRARNRSHNNAHKIVKSSTMLFKHVDFMHVCGKALTICTMLKLDRVDFSLYESRLLVLQ